MEDLTVLNDNELTSINGGFNQEAYDAGKRVGNYVSTFIALYGIYALIAL